MGCRLVAPGRDARARARLDASGSPGVTTRTLFWHLRVERGATTVERVLGEREFFLTVEGLDNRADVDDQLARLEPSLELLRGLLH